MNLEMNLVERCKETKKSSVELLVKDDHNLSVLPSKHDCGTCAYYVQITDKEYCSGKEYQLHAAIEAMNYSVAMRKLLL